MSRYRLGSISQLATEAGLPCVIIQKRNSEKARGMVRIVARRYVEK
jgi:hypothetical protein